jgi:predicted metal-dependent hydrolase
MMAAEDFKKEVQEWAKEIGVSPKEVHVRELRRKWASCSNKGRLTFSYTLLNELAENRSKVIVHELLHMKYPNHGKMFKTLYKSYLKKAGISCSINDITVAETKPKAHSQIRTMRSV